MPEEGVSPGCMRQGRKASVAAGERTGAGAEGNDARNDMRAGQHEGARGNSE